MFECPRHVAEVGGGAEQVAVCLEHVGQHGGQCRPDDDIDAVDIRVAPDSTASSNSRVDGDGV
jgi:hypothetical protein